MVNKKAQSNTNLIIILSILVVVILVIIGVILYFGVIKKPAEAPADTGEEVAPGEDITYETPGIDLPPADTSCVQEWQCMDWSNAAGQCGTRECFDINECIGLEPFRIETKAC